MHDQFHKHGEFFHGVCVCFKQLVICVGDAHIYWYCSIINYCSSFCLQCVKSSHLHPLDINECVKADILDGNKQVRSALAGISIVSVFIHANFRTYDSPIYIYFSLIDSTALMIMLFSFTSMNQQSPMDCIVMNLQYHKMLPPLEHWARQRSNHGGTWNELIKYLEWHLIFDTQFTLGARRQIGNNDGSKMCLLQVVLYMYLYHH